MPNRYIDEFSDQIIKDVISDYRKSAGMEISYSQAISMMYNYWSKSRKGDEKQ